MISVVDKDAVLWSRPDHLPARADQCSVILRTAAPMLEGVNFTSLSNLKLTGASDQQLKSGSPKTSTALPDFCSICCKSVTFPA